MSGRSRRRKKTPLQLAGWSQERASSLHPYSDPRRLKPLLGPLCRPPGAIEPDTGISTVAPAMFPGLAGRR
jgi:hypothetical protein